MLEIVILLVSLKYFFFLVGFLIRTTSRELILPDLALCKAVYVIKVRARQLDCFTLKYCFVPRYFWTAQKAFFFILLYFRGWFFKFILSFSRVCVGLHIKSSSYKMTPYKLWNKKNAIQYFFTSWSSNQFQLRTFNCAPTK